ncbi:hypothetical protein Agub_g11199 [Astrephomene gubernaculifera]|uniref:GDP-D-glucose phosphorylase 1 n=1 Tax=Astrephomene gubernaculifera TaxID=47775 RepID=A0AAD3HQG3_9CHLO|nr:hypothetical protein Agub_g11199 [Astrephomene gubernaculifera]
MAVSAVDTLCSLHDLLRRPHSVAVSGATSDLLVASCQDAYLPIYTFPARPVEGTTMKLPRIDSMPEVPDCFEEIARCDSPPMLCAPYGSASPSNPGFGALGALVPSPQGVSFNDLPLSLCHSTTAADVIMSDDDADAVVMLYDKQPNGGAAVPGGCCCPSRPLLRRHPSDVLLTCCGGAGSGGGVSVCTAAAAAAASPAAGSDVAEVPSRSLLEVTLMALWEDRADRGMFRYDVTQCLTRQLPGRLRFIAQLNEGRATKKRPTEFSADRVMRPFDPSKFNFKKAAVKEALVAFQPSAYGNAAAAASGAVIPPSAPLAATMSEIADSGHGSDSPHLVLINVSPIDYGHVLLVPRVLQQLPQALDCGTVLLALQFARELGSPHFRVGYNSLGAFATINHLHFHSYYLPLPMPCEGAEAVPLPGKLAWPAVGGGDGRAGTAMLPPRKRRFDDGAEGADGAAEGAVAAVRVSRLVNYPVNAFVVEATSSSTSSAAASWCGLEAVAAVVGTAAERMQAVNQPFNLLVSDAGRRVFVFPQCYAERQAAGVVPDELLDTGVNPASFEIAGHLVLKRGQDFAAADEAWACRLLQEVSLSEERFMEVASMCFGGGSC